MPTEASPFTQTTAGKAFLIDPPGGSRGPGVLVLHSWWGLNEWTRLFCSRVAKEGHTVLAPDLFEGVQPADEDEGKAVLEACRPDDLSGLVMSSTHTLRAMTANPEDPITVIGFSMGASLALWASARLASCIDKVVFFYGTQSIDFDDAAAKYQGHYGGDDHLVTEDDRILTESILNLGGQQAEVFFYPEAKHWFFEGGESFAPEAAELAWQRMLAFINGAPPTVNE